ncbi:MAG: hypothetical protein TR69_WS6001001102 [candidate division WS6 bacterium OLB20]|uniref:SbsA Ig-like domain-containing protein n=1 Tax=candidate division WS6 bacterium OLB20 TaxID=1617426 RepID=A0A136LZL6_9BACT|nr:MAG: hypothetical protein TR69_WS6001001102 [candidate division WS6 bacterium OLB20]
MTARLFIDNGIDFEYMILLAGGLILLLIILNVLVLLRRYLHTRGRTLTPVFLRSVRQAFKNILRRAVPAVVRRRRSGILRGTVVVINSFAAAVLMVALFDLFQGPGIRGHYPAVEGKLQNYEEPITIEFDRAVDTTEFQPYIFPEIDGEWRAEPEYDWMPGIKRKVAFYPKESMFPGKVFIYYAEVTDSLKLQEKWEYGINAYSVPVPAVSSVSPEKGSEDVGVDRELQFYLDNETGDFIEWSFEISPDVSTQLYQSDAKTINVRFESLLAQNTEYSYKLRRTPVRYRLDSGEVIDRGETSVATEGSFKTVKEPLLESIHPSGEGVYITDSIKVVFDQEMEQQSAQEAFRIAPEVAGTFSWEDSRTMIYDPGQNLAKETKYTVTLKQGIRSLKGGFTGKDVTHEFTTIGAVTAGFSPGGSSVDTAANISVYFNQPVDKASAESKFSISPSVPGSISWNGNTLTFNPSSDLAFSTVYTVRVDAGVKSINGIDSRTQFSRSFTTEAQVFRLNVPVYYQSLRFSCNLVAARMALAYRGISVSTLGAHSQIAKDNTPWNPDANTWGNPHAGYVGDIYGNQEGYGVYWGPLSSWMSGYRSNAVRVGWSRTQMLQAVQAGNPVIIWAHNGYSGSGANRSWTTPGGTNIYAIQGMHSYVVVGWVGPIDNPSQIILNDPNRGRWTISTGYFDALWSYFGRASVVVY